MSVSVAVELTEAEKKARYQGTAAFGKMMMTKRQNPACWRGFSYYRMSSGGGLRPLVPWLVIAI